MNETTNTAAIEVRIESYQPQWRHHFYELNAAWLRQYFEIEPIDQRVLSDPEREILADGGAVYFALLGDEVVGTCALKHHGHGDFELTKMAVSPARRRLGIGQKLVEVALAHFEARNGRELFLESNSQLQPALRLYERMGFVRQVMKADSEYARADIYMIYAPST